MQDVLEVKIKKKEVNLIVWLLPIISLLIAGWLLYKYYASLGPVINIYFKNSGGLEPKKSFVRFRDVKVGVVESVTLLKNGVLVRVRMHKDVEPYLNKNTKFWVVTPTIEVGKIKGLEALITGPYIQMYSKAGKFDKIKFQGLSEPPLNSAVLNGKIIKLIANDSYSLSEKMPVYYKSIKVGTIRRIKLKNNKVEIFVSIKKEFANYINNTTRFWNLRGIDIALDKDNLKVTVPGITQLLVGGIEFDTMELKKPLSKKYFVLYPSRSDAFENRLGNKREIINVEMKIKNDKNGLLRVGNPVMFRNFKIGYIKYMASTFSLKEKSILSILHVDIDVGAFGGIDDFKRAIEKGLSAEIVQNSPLFGNVKIKLIFDKKHKLTYEKGVLIMPVVYKKETSIVTKIEKFIDKLNTLNFKKPLDSFNKALAAFTKTMNDTDALIKSSSVQKLPGNINSMVKNADEMLKSIKNTSDSYNQKSIVYIKINRLLDELHNDLQEFYKIEKKIDNKPSSLIFGE